MVKTIKQKKKILILLIEFSRWHPLKYNYDMVKSLEILYSKLKHFFS